MHSVHFAVDADPQTALKEVSRDELLEMVKTAMARAERGEGKLADIVKRATAGLERAKDYGRCTGPDNRYAAESGALHAIVEDVIERAGGK